MRELEGRVEAVAGTFTAQNVASRLWSYATMGRATGVGLMRELEGPFNVQNVANGQRRWRAR